MTRAYNKSATYEDSTENKKTAHYQSNKLFLFHFNLLQISYFALLPWLSPAIFPLIAVSALILFIL